MIKWISIVFTDAERTELLLCQNTDTHYVEKYSVKDYEYVVDCCDYNNDVIIIINFCTLLIE